MKKYTYSKPYKNKVNYTVTFENGYKAVIKAKSRLEAINSKEMLQLQLTYGIATSITSK